MRATIMNTLVVFWGIVLRLASHAFWTLMEKAGRIDLHTLFKTKTT